MIALPTMWLTVAYIDNNTPRWDVSFHKSRRYTREQLHEYVDKLLWKAASGDVELLEFTVFDGDKEIWRGLI